MDRRPASVVKHNALTQYNPFDDSSRFLTKLQASNVTPRNLLNYLIPIFHGRMEVDLSQDQKAARDTFIRLYQHLKAEYSGLELGDTEQDDPDWQLARFKDLLSRYFFLGALNGNRYEVEEMQFGQAVDEPAEGKEDGILEVPVRNTERLFSLDETLGFLMHEMVHHFLRDFSCRCVSCAKNEPNTLGYPGDGHGPFFQILHRLVLSAVRNWHEDFKSIDKDDCPGEAISYYSHGAHRRRHHRDPGRDKDKRRRNLTEDENYTNKLFLRIVTRNSQRVVDVKQELLTRQYALEDRVWLRAQSTKMDADEFANKYKRRRTFSEDGVGSIVIPMSKKPKPEEEAKQEKGESTEYSGIPPKFMEIGKHIDGDMPEKPIKVRKPSSDLDA
ncbi:uncharacterized protein JN550_006295 [Neoarthrinium moseri]|uniref:uncharacterized protein n=1 Tax=Neoarthrinium moseri TaxID=1658444 RepID=UPI001FDCBF91|nr:uncharacterized protein JN550_006295 [Neoarthrinium moseri]KAI1868720.1 hypothetical protein JN550_006295 [Neoarthrinium moseri]